MPAVEVDKLQARLGLRAETPSPHSKGQRIVMAPVSQQDRQAAETMKLRPPFLHGNGCTREEGESCRRPSKATSAASMPWEPASTTAAPGGTRSGSSNHADT